MTIRRFYAAPEQFADDRVTLSHEETRHLRNVLRLRAGDEARLFDGAGREFACVIVDIPRSGAVLNVLREIEPPAPESDLDLTLAAAVYKNDKLDLVVQKAVELGVARFRPLVTQRSEASLRDAVKRTERWRKIALEATKQCERARIMTVDEPLDLDEFMADIDRGSSGLFIFSEKGGQGLPEEIILKDLTALVGPKGGWEDAEIGLAIDRGFTAIKLGHRIMRAETAAITFAALLQNRFGDLN